MVEDSSKMIHPRPRRPPFDFPSSAESSPSTPTTPSRQASEFFRTESEMNASKNASRTHSVLNLTSSTLFGIYAPSEYDSNRADASAPASRGSMTPVSTVARTSVDENRPPAIGAYARPPMRTSRPPQHSHAVQSYFFPLGSRTVLLFCFGVAYGLIVSHLHDTQQVAPVQIEGLERSSWKYLAGWGGVGVLLGGLLPWIDVLWEEVLGIDKDVFPSKIDPKDSKSVKTTGDDEDRPGSQSRSGLGADWNPVVRSIGAFIGIAFAIRRLPWQSTLQVSLTLALVNPVLWYLVDRSKPGFILSTFVGIAGTAIAFGVNPDIVPSPAAPSPRESMGKTSYDGFMGEGMISNESIGVVTWIASVLFCSTVCFGNIGRRLALGTSGTRSSVS